MARQPSNALGCNTSASACTNPILFENDATIYHLLSLPMPQNISTSSISKARASLPHTSGFGVHTESPKRARKTKTQKRKLVSYFHDDEKEKKRKRLAFLQGKSAPPAPSEPIIVDSPEDRPQLAESEPEDWVDDDDMADDTSRGPECNAPLLDASMDDSLVAGSANLPPKRLIPDEAARELYQRWKALVPSLANPLLTYLDSTIGKEWTRPAVSLKSECIRGGQCRTTTSTVTGLFFAGKPLYMSRLLDADIVNASRFYAAHRAVLPV